MPEISVVVEPSGAAYVGLTVGPAPEVRDSVALGELEAADGIPALDSLVLDFDHYGRLAGDGRRRVRVLPSLLGAAEGA